MKFAIDYYSIDQVMYGSGLSLLGTGDRARSDRGDRIVGGRSESLFYHMPDASWGSAIR